MSINHYKKWPIKHVKNEKYIFSQFEKMLLMSCWEYVKVNEIKGKFERKIKN
jgi:hypothetical protein